MGTVVGVVGAVRLNVAVNLGGIAFALEVFSGRFFGNSPDVSFESVDCSGPGFLMPVSFGAGVGAVLPTVAVIGTALYGADPRVSLTSAVLRSRLSVVDGICRLLDSPSLSTELVPVTVRQDLSMLFTPPFHAR